MNMKGVGKSKEDEAEEVEERLLKREDTRGGEETEEKRRTGEKYHLGKGKKEAVIRGQRTRGRKDERGEEEKIREVRVSLKCRPLAAAMP
ncbi:hypothetical protein PAMP_005254 [Pampus punctatissimus]